MISQKVCTTWAPMTIVNSEKRAFWPFFTLRSIRRFHNIKNNRHSILIVASNDALMSINSVSSYSSMSTDRAFRCRRINNAAFEVCWGWVHWNDYFMSGLKWKIIKLSFHTVLTHLISWVWASGAISGRLHNINSFYINFGIWLRTQKMKWSLWPWSQWQMIFDCSLIRLLWRSLFLINYFYV